LIQAPRIGHECVNACSTYFHTLYRSKRRLENLSGRAKRCSMSRSPSP
jgi:hypothetical protein